MCYNTIAMRVSIRHTSLRRGFARTVSGIRQHSPAALTAFGEDVPTLCTSHLAPSTFYTGKPEVPGLGHAFLMRNYRASLAKWQTADPLGYPDGWNQLTYCGNGVVGDVDFCGAWMTSKHADFFRNSIYYDGLRMKDEYLSLIINSDMAVDDDQNAASSYKHAMKQMGQSDSDANRLIEDFIQNKITEASKWAEGYISGLYELKEAASAIVRLLGIASHTYQDKLCPVHYENGSPHIWFDNWLIDWRHFPELFRYVTAGYVQNYKSWIEGKFHFVLKDNLDLINEIFE